MVQQNVLDKITVAIIGKKNMLALTDTAQIMSRPQQLQHSQTHKQRYQRMSQQITNHTIGGGGLALALSFSLRRYFPTQFNTFSANKVIVDLVLIIGCLGISTGICLLKISQDLAIIKRQLVLKYDEKFLNHMATNQIKYKIGQDEQVQGILSQKQYQEWTLKRYQIKKAKPVDSLI